MEEVWKPVFGFEGLYEVSNLGRVVSIKQTADARVKRPKAVFVDRNGYHRMLIWRDGHGYTRSIHRLVAEAFFGPRPNGMVINHLDGDKNNNTPENLEFVTCARNSRHAVEMGLTPRGEKANFAKLTEQKVREMRALQGTISGPQLGIMFGLSNSATYAILTRKTWKHVD